MERNSKPRTGPVKVGEVWWINDNQTLTGVHNAEDCDLFCPIHWPSNHKMLTWPLYWRQDAGIFERICVHGIGHPDPDSLDHVEKVTGSDAWGIHGCDGCCAEEE